MNNPEEITAIILAGGKSSRMKMEKGLVLFHGKMLVEHVIEAIKKITGNIIIITANADYKQFGYPCFADELENKGPLGGIYTGLLHTDSQKNIVVGCDLPFLSENILKALINKCGNEDVLLTEHLEKPEPLYSIYDRNCMAHIRKQLEQNQLKIMSAQK